MEKNRLFRGLGADELKIVQPLMTVRIFQEGERLMVEGEANTTLYLLDEGTIRFYRRRTGYQPQLLSQLEPGSFFGEVSIFDGQPALYDAYAASRCKLRAIKQQPLLEFLTQESSVAFKVLRNLLGTVIERSRDLDERFAHFAGNVTSLRRYNN